MKGALTALLVAVTLGGAPAAAAPNAQLVASVQHRLNVFGFDHVDAATLTTRQIAALHMQLQGRAGSLYGANYIRTRQRIQVILGWD
ncbi:hypothetical protein [Jannaschia pohangensis]|uniref:Peptidoglycan binding domain-containing protein n=1 Tax=Jannaschia pohangensis TaxID=390807 RepID=A0A1I3NJ88_9RHOB|nr:hypothetical protein [Jannaschia pohangensis]SFJ09205.1 hypothetical protein SAMN04488095_2169 [Jannaschia pohangensis]